MVYDILPEMIWIAIINEKFGTKRAVEIISSFIIDAFSIKSWDHPIDFSFISSFSLFTDEEKKALTNKISGADYKSDLINGLEIFCSTYHDNPLSFLFTATNTKSTEYSIIILKKVIVENIERRSHGAMITQSISYFSINKAGKVHYPKNFQHPDLNSIVNDFESDKAKESVGIIRMRIGSSYMLCSKHFGKDWAIHFWNQGQKIETPILNLFSDDEDEINNEMKKEKISPLVEYIHLVQSIVKERWNQLPKDIYNNHTIEVIAGLMSRQATLTIRIAKNPGIWDFHIGPIILRTMIDVHINLAWILTNPNEIAKKYIDYGLGQEKLQIEHLKQGNVDEDFKEDLQLMIEAKQSWLDYQHFSFLTTVDVGSWSGLSAREMADKSDCQGLYRYVYSPYSSCVHNMWNHVGKFDLIHSENPLHKFIRLPYDPDFKPEIDILVKSAKYFSRSIELIDEKYNINSSLLDPYEFWYNELNKNNNEATV